MAWSANRTWAVGEIATAANFNTYIRDQLAWIGGADGRGTSFPGSPPDGTLYDYVADAGNGVVWRFKFNSGEATYKWEFVGGPPMYAEVVTDESTASATYAALATAGPSITITRAGDYIVDQGCWFQSSGSNSMTVFMSYDIGGTGAVDADAVTGAVSAGGTTAQFAGARRRVKTGIAASTALVSKYKVPGAVTASFGNRWLSILPVRVI